MTERPPEIPTADTTDQLLSVSLAKYGSLREELFHRFQFQGQAFNFLIVVLTALIAVGAAQLEEGRGGLFDGLVLLIPLVTGPFGYLYLAHDLMIFGITGYLDRGLSRDISVVLGRDIVLSDARLGALSRRGRITLAALGYSRWLLFVVPTVGPIVYAALATDAWRAFPVLLLFAADCLVALGLLAAIWVTAREQIAWRHQHSRALASVKRSAAEPPAMADEDAGRV